MNHDEIHRGQVGARARRPRVNLCGNSPRGFTLLEVVLALGLTVMVMTLVTSAMYSAMQAKTSIHAALDLARNSGAAADLMAKELANALPPTQVPVTGTRILLPGQNANTGYLIGQFTAAGAGTTDPLVDFFTSGPEPKADLQPDVREVQYALVPGDDNTQNLVRRVFTNLLPSGTAPQTPPDVVIATHVVNVTFSFWDGVNNTDSWNPTQDATQSSTQSTTLPLVIEFTIELAPLNPGGPNRITKRTIALDCGTNASLSTSTTGGTP